jgi:hypothetical protein
VIPITGSRDEQTTGRWVHPMGWGRVVIVRIIYRRGEAAPPSRWGSLGLQDWEALQPRSYLPALTKPPLVALITPMPFRSFSLAP